MDDFGNEIENCRFTCAMQQWFFFADVFDRHGYPVVVDLA